MSTTTNLGRVRCTPKGTHDATQTYQFLDIVTKNGSSYMAIAPVPAGVDVTDTNYWQMIASKGNTGEIVGATATIEPHFGIPVVTVTMGGTAVERTFNFAFDNLLGNGITGIALQATAGLKKTYRVSYNNGTYFDFDVYDGNGISAIAKTGTSVLTDTYTITFTNGTSTTFAVVNGRGISNIAKTGTSGSVDTYTITYNDGTTSTYTVTNGSVTSVNGRTGAVTGVVDEKYDDTARIKKITNPATTLGDIKTILDSVNTIGDHIEFDVSSLGAQMYKCTIFIDTTSGVYKIFNLVDPTVAEGAYDATKLLVMCLANASAVATQAQIDYLQEEIDELGGKSVIKNWDVLGDLIESGTSTQYIEAGDKTNLCWLTSVTGTIVSGATVSCSNLNTFGDEIGKAEATTYLFVYNGSAWTYNEEVIDLADYALTVTGTPVTGDVMTITTAIKSVNYTFTGYDDFTPHDSNVHHNWCLEQTYAPITYAYDTYESLFCIQAGKTVPIGNYHYRRYCYRSGFYVDMYLHITQALGDANNKVQMVSNGYNSGLTVTNADGVTKTGVYAVKSVTPKIYKTGVSAGSTITVLLAPTSGVTYTELSDLNANDTVYVDGSFDHATFGSNEWPMSNICNWLNLEGKADSYEPTNDNDVPSSYNRTNGFLYGLDKRVKNLILEADLSCVAGYECSSAAQGQTYVCTNKVFLLSMKEMSFNIQTSEGNATDLYSAYCEGVLKNDAVAARAKYNKAGGTLNSYRWSRSAISSDASNGRGVASTGTYNVSSACYGLFVAPAFIIGKAST